MREPGAPFLGDGERVRGEGRRRGCAGADAPSRWWYVAWWPRRQRSPQRLEDALERRAEFIMDEGVGVAEPAPGAGRGLLRAASAGVVRCPPRAGRLRSRSGCRFRPRRRRRRPRPRSASSRRRSGTPPPSSSSSGSVRVWLSGFAHALETQQQRRRLGRERHVGLAARGLVFCGPTPSPATAGWSARSRRDGCGTSSPRAAASARARGQFEGGVEREAVRGHEIGLCRCLCRSRTRQQARAEQAQSDKWVSHRVEKGGRARAGRAHRVEHQASRCATRASFRRDASVAAVRAVPVGAHDDRHVRVHARVRDAELDHDLGEEGGRFGPEASPVVRHVEREPVERLRPAPRRSGR